MTEDDLAEYMSLLNPLGLDAIGTLEIEVINVHLPIFHGTGEGVLQAGLGHLEGSSLPIGGQGTHAVITGHRGLPSSTLLTNIDRLVLGDTFKIHVLNEELTYKVDQILIVEPTDTTALAIFPDADYCTLVTCTPYGINTHRLLVRGHRVANEETEDNTQTKHILTEARVINRPIAALLIIVPATLAVLVILFIRLRRVYGRGKKR
jgi:sortase A